ncbi:MAG: GntR family transcriptional regulator [Flavobacteriales bacterium]|nr:GntR family transcriptional regulator [Flavobacteriales bacterium]
MKIGEMNTLKVQRTVSIGVFLADDLGMEVLLPKRYVPAGLKDEDSLDVFIYRDSEDRTIATTEVPKAKVNQLAFLEVVAESGPGAFLDWGLPKDLMVPKKEQTHPLLIGNTYLFYVYLDSLTQRMAASTRLSKFLSELPENLKPKQEVEIIVWQTHELGYQVVVNEECLGMLYSDQVHIPVNVGQRMKAYVNQIRPDGRVDVLLQKPGYDHVADASKTILDRLKANDGRLKLTDKSSPAEIEGQLGMSKKSFKKAIGALYKHRKIVIEDKGIRLI